VTTLCKTLGAQQQIVSHRLGPLRIGRLVIGARKGRSVVYEIDTASLKELAAGLANLTSRK